MSFASGPADRFQGPPPSSDRYAYSNAYAGDVAQHPRPAPLRPAAQQQQYYDGYGQDAGYAQRPPLSAPPQAQGHEHYGGEFQGPPAHVTGQYGVRPAASHAYGTQPHPHQYAYSTPPSASSAYSQPVHPHQPPPIAPSASAPVVAQYTHDPYAPPPPMLPPQQQQPPRADTYYQRPPPQQHLPPPDQYYSQGEQGYYRHDPAHSPVPPQPQYPAQQPQYPAQQPQYPAQQPQYPAQRPPYSAGPGYGPPDPNPPHSRPTTFYGQQPPAVSGPVSSGPMRQPPVQHQIPPPLHNRPPQLSQSPPPPVLAHAPTMPPPHSRQSPRHNQSPMLPPGPAHAPTMPPPHHNQSPPPRNPALRHPPMRHSPVYQQRNSPQPQPLSQSQAQLQRHGSLNSHPGLAGSRPAMGSFGAPRNSPTPVTLAADPGYSSSAQVPGGLRRGASLYEQQRDMLVQQPQHMAALVGSMGALSLARSSPQPPNPAFSQPALAGSAQMPAPYRMQGGLAASAAALGTQARADVTGSTLSLAATENSACPMWANISADAFSAYQHQVAVQQSNLSGTKYALIVGINYYELEYSQTSNINGAHAFKALLMRRYGYAERNIVLLSDDQEDARSQPTHHNISTHVKRMMREVRPNDAVFFYFCGFGRLPAQLRERRSDVLSGIRRLRCDYILPSDFEAAGAIDAEFLHRHLVRPLPASARLTALFNCIVHETGLGVPYKYAHSNGAPVLTNAIAGSNLFEAGMRLGAPNASYNDLSQRLETSLMQQQNTSADALARIRQSSGDIIVFGWARDYADPEHKKFLSQTPSNQLGNYWAAAMESAMRARGCSSFGEVLAYLHANTRDLVMLPFIACGRKIAMDEQFVV